MIRKILEFHARRYPLSEPTDAVKLLYQNAFGVGRAALGREPQSVDALLPVYLRLSQAERERQARMG